MKETEDITLAQHLDELLLLSASTREIVCDEQEIELAQSNGHLQVKPSIAASRIWWLRT